ncbi:MAG: hypothetical protein P8Z81_04145 [Deinococcales bacterium]
MKRTLVVALLVAALALALSGCRNETQNRIRRSIQDFTNQRMYITLYSYDGKEVFNGAVDGKVTRSSTKSEGGASGDSQGAYIYWYDDRGRYHQSDLPYLLTTYDRRQSSTGAQSPPAKTP